MICADSTTFNDARNYIALFFACRNSPNADGIADFTHGNDSRVTAKNDLLDDKWDRTMKYDFAGRLTFAQFGMGVGTNNQNKRVYEESIGYDGFSMMNDRQTNHWENDSGFTETYVNGRISSFNGNYDAAGNIIRQGDVQSDPHTFVDTNYDASGRRTRMFDKRKGKFGNVLNMIQEHLSEYVFDGDGRPVIEKEGFQTYHVNDSPPNSPLTAAPKMYQVWSTVLGSNLTTVKPDETKWETKIFAGGAVIAKEGATGPQWVTSDPVTGTTVTWRKIDNDWLTSVEETEPLGQKIYNADPDPLPEPSYDNSVGNADFPQWQCQMPSKYYGNFYAMPWHCQFAEIKRRSFEGGYYVIEEPETNPNKVSGHTTGSAGPATPTGSAGPATGYQMAFSRLMKYTLGATRKPTKETGEDDPESDTNKRKRTFTVTINDEARSEPLETGWVAASNGIKVSLGGTDEARKALQSVLTQECDSKLTQVLAQLRVKDGRDNPLRSDTILGLFDKLVAQTKGGIWFDKTQEEFRNLLNSVSPGTDDVAGGGGVTLGVYEKGSRGLKNAAMFVGVFPRDVSTLGSGQGPATEREMSRRIAQAKRALLLILIHEIAHAAGQHQTFDHDEMNQAAKIVDEGVNDFEQFVTKHCEVGTYVPKYDAR
ncbi:MAG: hypothetical protein IPN69_22465 [Acidobacteria bacterium]|nr:hypothetical protein [Acidobacteriota bacterium]